VESRHGADGKGLIIIIYLTLLFYSSAFVMGYTHYLARGSIINSLFIGLIGGFLSMTEAFLFYVQRELERKQ
jgi:hypothetical protein